MGERIMSQQVQVDAASLLSQAQALQDRIAALQSTIAQLEQARLNVLRSIDTLKALNSDSMLVPSDPDYNALINVKPLEPEKVITKLGGNIYAKIPVEEAVKILEKRANTIEKQLQFLVREYEETAKALESIQALLQQLAVMSRQQQPQQQK